ncbi:type IV secretion system effector chaperone VirE1 [Agrobacterium rhizogenes]|uniref:Protein virE1 n=15 Tax=Rhizobium/Agrobacterium group TaxID=227290 RepID=VIRE1_AGRFC|nr:MULTISPECIES: type IV secretion system effector chaperone VirE1 [Rhizobium/Agrobacterium group]P08063.1 RecName: Full=Protein virE1; AltName: Full=7.1 kDa virulence protein [Agrobacterium fabrum str. C58]3BTP_B Chain B, Protein virE1 [unidentified]AAA91609.1 virE2 [Plasmid Ti]AYD05096.1 type IV secretion system chaperone [Neorhizobium sp. NCHU2750]KAA6481495.1 protein virE1 [Agrobacterium sp. ICMP 7243]KJF70429.1 type IV secretion system chaperone VirE1 [Agrobacterium arsenijevicii]OCJ083
MVIIKLNANKNMPVLAVEKPQEIHKEELSDHHQSNGFTSLDLEMIELENFVLHCPLPEENLAG